MNQFKADPFIGCPFDDTELELVSSHEGLSVGDTVSYDGPPPVGGDSESTLTGVVEAIGVNAKYFDGNYFTAVRVGLQGGVAIKTLKELSF